MLSQLELTEHFNKSIHYYNINQFDNAFKNIQYNYSLYLNKTAVVHIKTEHSYFTTMASGVIYNCWAYLKQIIYDKIGVKVLATLEASCPRMKVS